MTNQIPAPIDAGGLGAEHPGDVPPAAALVDVD